MSAITPAYTILSLDGGGIRGIIPCKVLMYIEDKLAELSGGDGPHLSEVFDLISGTSTGGMLACGLTIKGSDGRPRYRAKDLLPLYTGEIGEKIFAEPLRFGWANFFRSLSRAKFTAENIEEALEEYFGTAKLSECTTDLLITSYNTEAKKPFYFKSTDCRLDPTVEDFLIRDIARATSAAPTYFPPKQVKYQGVLSFFNKDYQQVKKQLHSLSLVDGGVFANNPAVLAYVEAKNLWRKLGPIFAARKVPPVLAADPNAPELVSGSRDLPEVVGVPDAASRGMFAQANRSDEAEPFLMLSIGTGAVGSPYPYEKVERWGLVDWVRPLIDILMQGVSESVDYQMKHLLPPYEDGTPRYLRLNIELDPDHAEMDDPSEENTDRLQAYGDRIVNHPENRKQLDEFCAMLLNRQRLEQWSPRTIS